MVSGKLEVTPHWSRLDNGRTAPLEGSQEKMVLELTAPKQGEGEDNKVFMELVVVLDVSGSMAGSKLQKLKETMLKVIEWVRPRDHLCIISFADVACVVFPMHAMDGASRNKAVDAVNGLVADGCTNMQMGLELAVDEIRRKSDARNHAAAIVLMSDGAENQGSDARRVPVHHVPVETIGFGTEQEHKVLEDISRNSNGGVFSNSWHVNNLGQVISPLLDYRKHIVITNLVLTLEQEPTMSVEFGTYPQDTGGPGTRIIRAGSLIGDGKYRVTVNFYLPQAHQEGNQTVMTVRWTYRLMPGAREERGSIQIDIYRRRALASGWNEVPKKVRTEEIRLSHVVIIKDVRRLADEGKFDEAQERLAVGMGVLDDALDLDDSGVSKSAIRFFYAEVEELFALTDSEDRYKKQGGQACVHACISSHDRQRYTARGDAGCRIRLFTTLRMNQYLEEAILFDSRTYSL